MRGREQDRIQSLEATLARISKAAASATGGGDGKDVSELQARIDDLLASEARLATENEKLRVQIQAKAIVDRQEDWDMPFDTFCMLVDDEARALGCEDPFVGTDLLLMHDRYLRQTAVRSVPRTWTADWIAAAAGREMSDFYQHAYEAFNELEDKYRFGRGEFRIGRAVESLADAVHERRVRGHPKPADRKWAKKWITEYVWQAHQVQTEKVARWRKFSKNLERDLPPPPGLATIVHKETKASSSKGKRLQSPIILEEDDEDIFIDDEKRAPIQCAPYGKGPKRAPCCALPVDECICISEGAYEDVDAIYADAYPSFGNKKQKGENSSSSSDTSDSSSSSEE